MDEDESSEGDARIERFQRQARRRLINRHIPHQSTDTTASLPEYTSSPPSAPELPPKYPQLTAEEADEERDEVGDVVRRVRLRRKRSGSDSSYLDSLLARSVHALELSNALLQSSMTTQSSLSALLSRDDTFDRSLDTHARFLANQMHASDTRRAWVEDLSRQLDSLDSPTSVGLSQSLPDTQNAFLAESSRTESGLRQGDRPRSPPPRCMTVYADTSLPPDSILIPSTNGLRSMARVHDFVPTMNHSRQSSVSEDGVFARQQALRTPSRALSHSSHPSTSTTHSVYQHNNGNASSPVLTSPHRRSARRVRSQLQLPVQSQQYSSHQPSTPVQPVLSAGPIEPSTPAYNLLSAIATRSPHSGTDSDSGVRPARSDRLGLGLGHASDTGSVRGRGSSGNWVPPLGITGPSTLRRTRSVTPSTTPSAIASPLRLDPGGPMTTSPSRSKTTSRSGSTTSIPTTTHPTPIQSSPNRRVVRHPFLQAPHPQDSVSDTEGEGARLQRFKSAQVLRRILDVAREKAEAEAAAAAAEEAARKEATKTEDAHRGRPVRRPTWSVIPRKGTTVAVETVAPEVTLSIEGIAGGSVRGQSKGKRVEVDPLVLPGEFTTAAGSMSAGPSRTGSWLTPVAAGPSSAGPSGFGTSMASPLVAGSTSAGGFSAAEAAARSIPQRSQSVGPANRVASILSASLPKISVFSKAGVGVGEPPPEGSHSVDKGKGVDRGEPSPDKGKGKAVDETGPHRPPHLSLQLNGTALDPDATEVLSSSDDESEAESQPSQASFRLPARLFDSTSSIARPSSLRLPGSPRPSLKQAGSGASTPRSVTFSPLPPKHIPSGGRPLSEAKTRRKKPKPAQEKEKQSWFASWFGPLPPPSSKSGYTSARRGWDSPRSMDDWQM